MADSLAGKTFILLRFGPTETSWHSPGAKVGLWHRTTPGVSRDQERRGWAATPIKGRWGDGPAWSGRRPPKGLTASMSLGFINTHEYSNYLDDWGEGKKKK